MKCVRTGRDLRAGDIVLVEGGVRGVVVCDYDHWSCMDGYRRFLAGEMTLDGSTLGSGVLVKTDEIGLVLFPEQDDEIAVSGH